MIAVRVDKVREFTRIREPFDQAALRDRGLATTYLQWPIVVRIDSTDIFALEENRHLEIAVLGFARWGLAALEAARRTRKFAFRLEDFPGALLMQMESSDHVIVHCTVTGASAVAPFDGLHRAWTGFADWIRETVPSIIPGIQKYRAQRWDRWFSGTISDQPLELHEDWFPEHQQCISEAKKYWISTGQQPVARCYET